MSKRLQVILDDEEMRAIKSIAKRQRKTVAEWVRQMLRAARKSAPAVSADRKYQVVRAAARHSFPTCDIRQMLAEIERGYLEDNHQ
jgi:negative regulator of replication initiation